MFSAKILESQPVSPQSDIEAHMEHNISFSKDGDILTLSIEKIDNSNTYTIVVYDMNGNTIGYAGMVDNLQFQDDINVPLDSNYSGVAIVHLYVDGNLGVKQIYI